MYSTDIIIPSKLLGKEEEEEEKEEGGMMRCIALSPASNAISKLSAMFNSRQINKLAFPV